MVTVGTFIAGRWVFRDGFKNMGWCWGKPKHYLTVFGLALFIFCAPILLENLLGLHSLPADVSAGAILGSFLTSFVLTIIPGFGEEFGWRAYLLPKLMPLGGRRAVLLSGVIWGVWHWPVIAMGHNYGLDYPGYPWLGMLLMVLVCIGLGSFLSWVTLRAGSVWPAVIGHAAINGISALGTLALKPGAGNVLLGPLPVGIIGMSAWMLATVLIFASRKALQPAEKEQLAISS